MLLLHLLLLIIILQLSTAQEPPELTVVAQTSAGPVRGFDVDYGSDRSQLYYGRASIFLGVPFAKAPLGDLRFKLPQPLCRFNEEVGSTVYKPRCPQGPDTRGFSYETSEDCLYLNVFTPNISDGRKRAVMFYVPGGVYQLGGADIYDYKASPDPDSTIEEDGPMGKIGAVRNMVSRDVVVVVTQYRLSTLGFFTTFSPEFPANRGIFDVLAALRWTQNEIANFGGDPDRVTLFGHSAGACITDALSYSPLAKGLFQQILIQSGPAIDGFNIPDGYGKHSTASEIRAEKLCNITDLRFSSLNQSTSQLQQCFSGLNGDEMVKADTGSRSYGMSLDGVIFPLAHPSILARDAHNYVVMQGDTTNEYAFNINEFVNGDISGVNKSTLESYLKRNVPYLSQEQLVVYTQTVLAYYDPNSSLEVDDHLGWTKMVSRVISDHNYLAPARKELQWYKNNNNGANVFLYNYNYFNSFCLNNFKVEGWTPPMHCAELCFLWFYPYEWEKAAADGRIHRSDLEVAENLGLAWTNFAKYGNPGWAPMRDRFEYVEMADTVSDMRQDWGKDANALFNEKLPALLKMEMPPYHMDPAVKAHIERQAPSVMRSWVAATCPTWKPLKTTKLTVYPVNMDVMSYTGRHGFRPDSSSHLGLSYLIVPLLLIPYYS